MLRFPVATAGFFIFDCGPMPHTRGPTGGNKDWWWFGLSCWREKKTNTKEIRSKELIQENAVDWFPASLSETGLQIMAAILTLLPLQHHSVLSFSQEWHLMCSHYIVLSAFKGSCQGIKEELFYQQHSGKYFNLPQYSANVTLLIWRYHRRLRCYEWRWWTM